MIIMPIPRIYAVVGSRKHFAAMFAFFSNGGKMTEGSPVAYGLKLDPKVKKNELQIRDIHGHTFATFYLKKI